MSVRRDLWRVVLTTSNNAVFTYMVLETQVHCALEKALGVHYKVVLDSRIVDATTTRTDERVIRVSG